MPKLTAPNGVTVSVADGKVEALLRRGFTKPSGEAKKAPAKKAASSSKSESE